MLDDPVHTVPINDLIEHTESEDCVCGPDVKLVHDAYAGDCWQVVHHSLDGRELREETGGTL